MTNAELLEAVRKADQESKERLAAPWLGKTIIAASGITAASVAFALFLLALAK